MTAKASIRRSSRSSPLSRRSRNSTVLASQLVVGQLLHLRLEGVDVGNHPRRALTSCLRPRGSSKKVKALEGIIPDINALGDEMHRLSDDAAARQDGRVPRAPRQRRELDDILIEAFAVTREAAVRVIGQRHFDVQLMGGAALHFGWVAEMKTGEGKTLVSTLPAYLNGLGGKGVHLVTVNDYLARRDAEWMGRSTGSSGSASGSIIPGSRTSRRRSARSTRPTSPTAPTTSSASTTSATTWRRGSPTRSSAATTTRSSTRSTRSSSTRRARR